MSIGGDGCQRSTGLLAFAKARSVFKGGLRTAQAKSFDSTEEPPPATVHLHLRAWPEATDQKRGRDPLFHSDIFLATRQPTRQPVAHTEMDVHKQRTGRLRASPSG